MKIVPFEPVHLAAVVDIEQRDGDVRWTRAHFEKELGGEIQRFFVVLGSDPIPTILGYGGYWKVGPEAQITNLAVRAEARRKGTGRRLMEFLMDCARGEECQTCTLEVRKSNRAAQGLYQSLGFVIQGTRPRMYSDPVDDGVLMEKSL